MRSYDDNGDAVQSFRRGEYTIPANYAGNAFTADEPPIIKEEAEIVPKEENSAACENTAEETSCALCQKKSADKGCEPVHKSGEGGLLRGLFSRIEHGFDFDDLLLIGLIILLIRENRESGQKNDEIVILLAILLLSGF